MDKEQVEILSLIIPDGEQINLEFPIDEELTDEKIWSAFKIEIAKRMIEKFREYWAEGTMIHSPLLGEFAMWLDKED